MDSHHSKLTSINIQYLAVFWYTYVLYVSYLWKLPKQEINSRKIYDATATVRRRIRERWDTLAFSQANARKSKGNERQKGEVFPQDSQRERVETSWIGLLLSPYLSFALYSTCE